MPQGFQTLDSTTVAKVAAQDGVAHAVGGLSLQVTKVNGQFKHGELRRAQGGTGAKPGTSGGGTAGAAGGNDPQRPGDGDGKPLSTRRQPRLGSRS
ncbi:hypothetical protein [Streptomyces sp. H27-H5]|uniref:hypothetical protein n=1 Tax=Streptomyces sp. H27-H5 TaxID=2996460 RepID=UPI003B63FB4F